MWMLIKGWPQQREILVIKWRRWPILWLPVSLIPQLPLSLPNGLMKWPRWQIWRLCMGSSTRKSPHQNQPDYNHCWVLSLPAKYPTQWHHSPVWSASFLMAGWWHRTTSIMEGQCFALFLQEQMFTWDTDLPSLHTMSLPKPSVIDLHYVLPHSTASDQGTDQCFTSFISVLYTDGLQKLISFSTRPHEMRSFTITILQWGKTMIVSG